MTAADVARWTGADIIAGDPATRIESWTNDSRSVSAGSAFVAIVAERDGHDFIADAQAAGAVAVLASRRVDAHTDGSLAYLVHPDVRAALAAAATAVRNERLDRARVVGITGSTGKTSTKDLLAAAVATRFVAHANVASFNNEIGLPLTVLGAPDATEVLICEKGARFAGNIAELAAITRPDVGVVTNIGNAHAEHLGGIDGIVTVKSELLAMLPARGVAVLPVDDVQFPRLAAASTAPVLAAGRAADADVRLAHLELGSDLHARVAIDSDWGRVECRLGLAGAHQADNAVLAAAVALWLGVDAAAVAAGLADATGSHWRMELRHSAQQVLVINDAYNANPTSMTAALEALRRAPARSVRIAVLGTMRELGADSDDLHRAVGAHAAQCADVVVAVGAAAEPIADGARRHGARDVRQVADALEAVAVVAPLATAGAVVLVKASRAEGLEAVAAALLLDEAATA